MLQTKRALLIDKSTGKPLESEARAEQCSTMYCLPIISVSGFMKSSVKVTIKPPQEHARSAWMRRFSRGTGPEKRLECAAGPRDPA